MVRSLTLSNIHTGPVTRSSSVINKIFFKVKFGEKGQTVPFIHTFIHSHDYIIWSLGHTSAYCNPIDYNNTSACSQPWWQLINQHTDFATH